MKLFKSLKKKVSAEATKELRREFQPEINKFRERAEELKAKADRAEQTINETAEEAKKTMKSVRRNCVLAVVFTAITAAASVTAAVATSRK